MAYEPYGLTTAEQIIKRAALMNDERAVFDGRDPMRALVYYEALNEFMQSLGWNRSWWFLDRDGVLATKSGQSSYSMRLQASATVTFADVPADAAYIQVNSNRKYEFDTDDDGVTSGNVEVDTSDATTTEDVCDAFVSAVNGDDSAECAAIKTSSTTVELYWAGDDGDGKAVAESGDTGNDITVESFSLAMEDFGALTSRPKWRDSDLLIKLDPDQMREVPTQVKDGAPVGYAMTGGPATMRIWGSGYGAPDGIYLIEFTYQALMSAVLPSGEGQIDIPLQFRSILPRAVKLIVNMDVYDEEAVFGDQYVQRWLGQMEAFQVDRTLDDPTPAREAGNFHLRIETEVADI